MRGFWIGYGVVAILLLTYTGLGYVASRTTTIPIQLTVGESAQVSILRLNAGDVRTRALFTGERHGPERARFDEKETATFGIEIALGDRLPTRYSLGETTGWGSDSYERKLDGTRPMFRRGLNQLRAKITAVDPSLVGERIEIWVDPALGFKSAEPDIDWLWPSFLSFIYLPILAFIGILAAIVHVGLSYRARIRRSR